MEVRHELNTHAVEDWHWWYSGRRRILHEVLAALPVAQPWRVLDAGCGSGRNLVELARYGTVTGLEPAAASLAAARARGVGEVVEGGLDAPVPLPDDSFDVATCLDVVEHLDDDRFALRELRRLVRPGGRLVVTVPCYQALWSQHDVVNRHRRRYSRRTLLAAARDAGWAPERTTHFNALLLPAAAAARGLERLRPPRDPGASDLDRTPRALNAVLERPLRAEARLIGAGRRLPAGLSLLAVLR
ncbi:MAG TPA: class I SAM-dependent methyltransferase [Capillimicrobium sp.]|nr:class I SAM-dependent methyltransferase [Capillimicrobium sp.]